MENNNLKSAVLLFLLIFFLAISFSAQAGLDKDYYYYLAALMQDEEVEVTQELRFMEICDTKIQNVPFTVGDSLVEDQIRSKMRKVGLKICGDTYPQGENVALQAGINAAHDHAMKLRDQIMNEPSPFEVEY